MFYYPVALYEMKGKLVMRAILRKLWNWKIKLFKLFLLSLLIFATPRLLDEHHQIYKSKLMSGPCSIPYHDAFDKSIMKFFYHLDPLVCPSYPDPVFVDEDGYLRYNQSAKNIFGNVSCYYREVQRQGDYNVTFLTSKRLDNVAYIRSDGIKVECIDENGRQAYRKILLNVDYKNVAKLHNFKNESAEELSVLIFGLDSVSRLAAMRKLPKTINYLLSLGAYIFKGYTKTGENTFPNLHALLTGKREKETNYYENKPADNIPFIWKDFQKEHYVTMFAEDAPRINSFNTVAGGFEKKPVHHYMRPMFLAMKKVLPHINSQYNRKLSIQLILDYIFEFCYGNEPRHQIQLNYFKRFLQNYRNKRKFAFSWLNNLSHDSLNFLDYGDEDFVKFFKWMKEEGVLNNAILILIGDHGSNSNTIRNTPIGRIEARMPLFTILVPDHVKEQSNTLHQILTTNAERLVSHYDVYETMVDVLKKSFMSTEAKTGSIGRSIFKEIPKERSCIDAGIPDMYCPCYIRKTVTVDSPKIKKSAEAIVKKINTILTDVQNQCSHLRLEKVENAEVLHSSFVPYLTKKSLRQWLFPPEPSQDEQFSLVIRTHPGHALFETMVIYKSDNTVEIGGYISRANVYGNQSDCVKQRSFKPYCFCQPSPIQS